MTKPPWYRYDPSARRWKYIVTRPVTFFLPDLRGAFDLFSASGKKIAITGNQFLTILPDYAYDGATGAPDFRRLLKSVLLHDLLCQAAPQYPRWPISRRAADRAFYEEARIEAPILARVYYAGILIGGGIHRAIFPITDAEKLTIIAHPNAA